MRIRLNLSLIVVLVIAVLIVAAYTQWALFGLPALLPGSAFSTAAPQGFPGWLRITHYINFFFIILLIRSGLQVLGIPLFLWPNSKVPTSDEWKKLAADHFKDYRLKVTGLVDNPVELSLDDLQRMGIKRQTTLHRCIQGWSGIAEWGGLPTAELIRLVQPKANAHVAVFYSFGEGLEGGQYYDSHSMANLLHPLSLLAYEMNFQPIVELHGAPLRLRVENQLGFKMVKLDSIDRIHRKHGIRGPRRRRIQRRRGVFRRACQYLKIFSNGE